MIDGMIILGNYSTMQGAAILLLMVGLIVAIVSAVLTSAMWIDMKRWMKLTGIAAIFAGAVMFITGIALPSVKGIKVTLTDPSKMPELMEKYEILDSDNLILSVIEKEDK